MNNVVVSAASIFKPEYSDMDKSKYYFEYEISIKNKTESSVKLLSRHWSICNSFGEIKKIDGEGVVGQKPKINPGEIFKYKSFCPLNTKFGTMKGFYTLRDVKGNLFKIKIPEFPLILPGEIN